MKNKAIIILSVICLILIGITGYLFVSGDKNAPKITSNNDNFIYSDNTEMSAILNNVSAYDEEDGDVSDSIIIESINVSDDKAVVVYVAKDSANHVAKLRKTYDYQTESAPEPAISENPVITLKNDEVDTKLGEDFSYTEQVESITDDVDEPSDLFKHIQLYGEKVNTEEEGTYEVVYLVYDSEGNKSNEAKLLVNVVE